MNEDALGRVRRSLSPDALDALAALPGTDLTTALLELSRRRAEALSPADVAGRYREDRFVRPGQIDPATIRAIENALFSLLPEDVEELALSPLVPIGTHGLGGVAQSRLLTTDRATEVAADPTAGLALEAGARRRSLPARSTEVIRLAASQRVVRGQRFHDEAAFSHFQLFGMVSAGRDTGDLTFERETLLEHLRFLVGAIRHVTERDALLTVTDWTAGRLTPAVTEAFGSEIVRLDPERRAGRGYYRDLCFKVHVAGAGEPFEVADGGFVDWTQLLLSDRKERLLISGLGVERLALSR